MADQQLPYWVSTSFVTMYHYYREHIHINSSPQYPFLNDLLSTRFSYGEIQLQKESDQIIGNFIFVDIFLVIEWAFPCGSICLFTKTSLELINGQFLTLTPSALDNFSCVWLVYLGPTAYFSYFQPMGSPQLFYEKVQRKKSPY